MDWNCRRSAYAGSSINRCVVRLSGLLGQAKFGCLATGKILPRRLRSRIPIDANPVSGAHAVAARRSSIATDLTFPAKRARTRVLCSAQNSEGQGILTYMAGLLRRRSGSDMAISFVPFLSHFARSKVVVKVCTSRRGYCILWIISSPSRPTLAFSEADSDSDLLHETWPPKATPNH